MAASTLHEFLSTLKACGPACERVGTMEFEQAWNTTDRYTWLLWVGTKVGLDAEVAAAKAEIEVSVSRKDPIRTRVQQCGTIVRKHLTFAAIWQAALAKGLVAS